MIRKSHQNLVQVFKIGISQRNRNTYFKGAFCWLKILMILLEAKKIGRFDWNKARCHVSKWQKQCFEWAYQSLELRVAIMGTYLKKSRNDNKAVSKKCVRSEEVPKHLKFKCKRDVRNLKYMRWSIRRRVEARERHCSACSERGRILQQDRYGRSSINRSLSIRISCVISIVQKTQ